MGKREGVAGFPGVDYCGPGPGGGRGEAGQRTGAMAPWAGVGAQTEGLLGRAIEHKWRTDGTVYVWSFDWGEVRLSIQDEAGKSSARKAERPGSSGGRKALCTVPLLALQALPPTDLCHGA